MSADEKRLANVEVMRDEKAWEVEVKAELPLALMERYRAEALKELQKHAKLDGFRQGKAPLERVLAVYGEGAVLRRAAEDGIQHELPELLASENLLIIETPRVTMEEPVAGKGVRFSARAALAPSVTLPDYAKIAEKHRGTIEDTSVSDKEHAEAMLHLRRERARIDKMEQGAEPQKALEEARALDESALPALDDTFVQTLGYENAEKFAEALRANIKTEKEIRAREKKRAAMLDELVEQSKISYPKALREYELDDIEARVKDDIARAGSNWEGYLAQVKKTREELRESWTDAADKRAKVRLILAEIGRKENIEPDEKAVAHEIEHAKQHYPDANVDSLRAHIAHAMRNEMTLRFLEGNTEKVGHTADDHQH